MGSDYVGRLVAEEGLGALEEATELKERGCSFRLDLIGDGSEIGRFESQVVSLGLGSHVRFTGFLCGAPWKVLY